MDNKNLLLLAAIGVGVYLLMNQNSQPVAYQPQLPANYPPQPQQPQQPSTVETVLDLLNKGVDLLNNRRPTGAVYVPPLQTRDIGDTGFNIPATVPPITF